MKRTLACYGLVVGCSIPVYGLYSETASALIFGNLAQTAGLVVAIASYLRLSNRFARNDIFRSATQLLAFGTFIWMLGQWLEMYCELILKLIAYGTVSDALWVAGYVFIIYGLHLILKEQLRSNGTQSANLRPLLIVAILAYAVLFYFLILPQLKEPDPYFGETILDFLYPTLDFVLILQCLAIAVVSKASANFYLFSLVTAGGILITLLGDAILSLIKDFHSITYLSIDVYYFTSYFLMALAADLEWKRRSAQSKLAVGV